MMLRALAADARPYGVTLALRDAAERPWSSATFTGARLDLVLAIDGADPAAWLAALPEAELPVPGRLVADLAVVTATATATTATLQVLLLET